MNEDTIQNLLTFTEYAFYVGCMVIGVAGATKLLESNNVFTDLLTGDLDD